MESSELKSADSIASAVYSDSGVAAAKTDSPDTDGSRSTSPAVPRRSRTVSRVVMAGTGFLDVEARPDLFRGQRLVCGPQDAKHRGAQLAFGPGRHVSVLYPKLFIVDSTSDRTTGIPRLFFRNFILHYVERVSA
ncbi:MAG: hypothetical protein WDM88_09445 [Galbitalea sp.]